MDKYISLNTYRRSAIATAIATLATTASAPGFGQESQKLQLEEVLVTATKREAGIEEIPIAVSTINAAGIRDRGLERFEDYLATVPGVQYNPGGSVYNAVISMRGVNDPGAENGLTQAPVAVYLDEAPLTVSQGSLNLDYSLFGIDQITVIKGPHSTLYGASSLGGTLKVETRGPSLDESSIQAQLSYSSISDGDDGYTAAVSGSVPLAEGKAAVELTAYSIDRGGYIDDPSRGVEDINGSETTGGRLVFSFLPTEDLSIDAKIYYQDYESDGLSLYAPSTGGDLISRPLDRPQTDGDEILLGSLEINYDLGFADLVSATSVFERENFLLRSGFFFGSSSSFDIESTAEAITQELRLVSNSDSGLEWLAGVYFANEEYDELGGLSTPFFPIFTQDLLNDITTYAAFGEVTFNLSERLDLTVGARASRYEIDSKIIVGRLDFFTFQFGLETFNVDFDETDISPRVALNYQIENGSVYIQAARGFRIGQPNTPVPEMSARFVDAFDSDYLWNYEIGAKTEWWDNRLRLNAAAFFIDWSDIQTTLFTESGQFTFVSNVGSAEVMGLEVEMIALLAEGLTLEGGFSYTEAEFASDVASQGIFDGDTLPGVPEVQFSLGLQYDFEVGGRDGFLRADYLRYDEFVAFDPFSFDPTSRITNGDYDRFNARVGISLGDFQVALFGNNLNDERPRMTVSAAFGEDATTIQPRTWGINLIYSP